MPFINALELCSWIFGTKGEVLPVAVVVSTLAKEKQHYHFTFITQAAHNQKYRGELLGFVQTTERIIQALTSKTLCMGNGDVKTSIWP
jgi:hypothetical protein